MAASLTVEAEFAGFGGGWTDITADVTSESVEIDRGFQSSTPDDLVAGPAMLRIGLRSSAGIVGYYSPDSSSCRSGWGLQSRLRIKVTANATTRTRFVGWVQSIVPTPGRYENATVSVTAASWLQLAADTLATGLTVQTSKRGDELLATVVAVAQFAPPSTAYATGADTYPYALHDINPETSYLIDAIDSIVRSGIDRVFEKADGTLVFERRSTRQTGATNLLSLTDVAPSGSPGQALTAIPLTRSRQTLWNQFLVVVHPGQIDASAVVLYAYQTSASSSTIATGTSITLDGPYQDPNQKAQRVAGFNMIDNGAGGLPTSDWQITTGPAGTGSDISASCTVTVTFEVNKAVFVITNSSGFTGYISKLQCRGQGYYDYQAVIGRAINSSGVTSLGRRTARVDCPYQATPLFAQAAADYLLEMWGDERSLMDRGVECFIHADDDVTLNTLLALDISDPIGVQETATGLAGAYWINGVTESYDDLCNTTLSFKLVPRWSGQVWKLGTVGYSELQTTTVLAYL